MRSSVTWVIVLVLAAAALPRAAVLLVAPPSFDSVYWELAGNLLQHRTLGAGGTPTSDYEPLYPLFLAAARAVSPGDIRAAQALQALVDAAAAPLFYLLVDALTGSRRTAVLAAVLYGVHPLLVRHAVAPGEFSLMSCWLVAFAYAFVTARTTARAAAAGAFLGLAILTRTMALPLVVLAAGVLWLERRQALIVPFAATALAVVLPLAVRNQHVSGSMLPTRSGLNLFIGNSRYTPALIPDHSPDALQQYAASLAERHTLPNGRPLSWDAKALDGFFTRRAFAEARRRPAEILWLKIRNVAYFFWPRLVPRYGLTSATVVTLGPDGRIHVDGAARRSRVEDIGYTLHYGFIVAAAAAGIVARRGAMRRDLVLWCILLTFLAACVVYFPATRYRTPTEFVLLFYAALGIEALARSRRGTSSDDIVRE